MHGRFQPGGFEHPRQVVAHGPVGLRRGWKHVVASGRAGRTVKRPHSLQNGRSSVRERHPVFYAGLHPRGRYAPFSCVHIDLRPPRAPRLAGPNRGQHQELQARLDRHRCRGAVDPFQRGRHVPIVERPMVRRDLRHRGKRAVDALARGVVVDVDVAVRSTPSERRADGSAEFPGGWWLRRPDGRQDAQHVTLLDPINAADPRWSGTRIAARSSSTRRRRLGQAGAVRVVRQLRGPLERRRLHAPDSRKVTTCLPRGIPAASLKPEEVAFDADTAIRSSAGNTRGLIEAARSRWGW